VSSKINVGTAVILFNSISFLLFIAIVLLIYPRLALRKQNLFLLIASYLFYGFWDWRFNFLILSSTTVDYFVGKKIFAARDHQQKRRFLLVSIIFNLCILGFFKYFNFFVDSLAVLLGTMGFEPHLPVLRIILPLGISFYTFRTISYTIDIYRNKITPTNNFIDYALFVSFFPQLLAGPIERASNLLPQFENSRKLSSRKFIDGFSLIILGYFKKVAIADTLAPLVEKYFSSPASFSSGELLSGMYAFTFQIYGDFSGYTDIARGVALMLGFKTMENFNTPYFSRNVTEFWRRWHISLSTWLRDYLYISLGGNRVGKTRTYINLMITMFLGGLWHGAAWTFVVWGTAHGAYLCIHKFLFGKSQNHLSWPRTVPGWIFDTIKIFLTFHLVAFTWIAFKAQDFQTLLIYIKGIFRFESILNLDLSILFACSLMVILDLSQAWTKIDTWLFDNKTILPLRYALTQILLISIIAAAIAHVNTITPFIYFQF
jgi:alginate O-acetyltransferase complex protein AlgI